MSALTKRLSKPFNIQNVKRTLDFKLNKIENLSLEELKVTRSQKIMGKAMHGMFHYQFIESLLEIIDKKGLDFDIPVLFAANNENKHMPGAYADEELEDKYGEGNIQAYTLNRIYSQVNIKSLEDEVTSTGLAFTYNQMGVQVALGPNVKICTNLCIFGAERYMSTYGRSEKMPTAGRMLEVIGDWLQDFESIRAQDLKTIDNFQNTVVPDNEVMEILGDLYTMRVKRDDKKFGKQPMYPLNQGQITKFATTYLVEQAKDPSKIFSAWELYNFATDMYKPDQTDMPLILSNNHTMSHYLMNRYGLN